MNQYRCETCKFLVNKNWAGSGDCSNPKLDEPIWMHKSASGYDDGAVYIIEKLGCASHSDESPHISSSDLLLMAHDEWKRREERKHIHEHISWVNGWISGFLTSRKFVQEKVAELRQKGGVCMRGLEKCSKDCDDCPDTYTCSESSK